MPPDTSLRWSLVIPVKVLALAKSRLTGLAGPRRAELALAMAADTVAATVACPVVDTVIVVTDDAAAAADLSGLGAVVVPICRATGSTRRWRSVPRRQMSAGRAGGGAGWPRTCPRSGPPSWPGARGRGRGARGLRGRRRGHRDHAVHGRA